MRAKILSFSLLFALLFALLVPSAGAAYPGAPAVRATSALFLNIDSGAVLLSQNTDAEIDPGSLVKLMTGLLVVENVKDLEGTVTVSETAIQGLDGLTTSSLQPGEEMTARDLLCCALIYSSADACNALAEHSAGSIDQFVKMMNEKAKALGMEHTVFVNTHGGSAEGQVSTVDDLQKLALYVLQNKTLTNICDTSYKTILPTNKNDKKRYYYNKNYSIISAENRKVDAYYNKYATGLMASDSKEQGYSLITKVAKGDLNMLLIIVGGERIADKEGITSYLDAKALSEWCFNNFQYSSLIKEKEPVAEVGVKLSSTVDKMTVVSGSDFGGIIPIGITADQMERRVEVEDPLRAPLTKGEEVGRLIFSYDGVDYGSVSLVSQHDANVSWLLVVFDVIITFFKSPLFLFILVIVLVLSILYFFFFVRHNRRLRKKRSQKIQYLKKHRR